VRFLASIWQQKMQANFGVLVNLTPKEKGQLKALRLHWGDLTRDVIEWIVDPVNWWHFCQQVRTESKNHMVADEWNQIVSSSPPSFFFWRSQEPADTRPFLQWIAGCRRS
jgi:hypothetical protein